METQSPPTWGLFVDWSSEGVGLRTIVLVSIEVYKLNSMIKFGFKTSNNATEYEALKLAREMKAKRFPVL